MWYLINKEGERCRAVETEEEAIAIIATDCWYVDYVYSNESYTC